MISKNFIFYIFISIGILSAQLSVSLGDVEYAGYSSDIEVPVIINNIRSTPKKSPSIKKCFKH